jgi:hypothetical protein
VSRLLILCCVGWAVCAVAGMILGSTPPCASGTCRTCRRLAARKEAERG